ncbi:MAG: HEAT repeat domain-containing protein [Myxococcales bacterium]|nr:HEAT repeat domain-containing protein [Myxococcales bacterium]
MGLRDLFSSSARSKSRLDKLIRKVENKYAQSPDRYAAMEDLLNMATVPSLIGVMRRFTIAASKSIEDEEEKGWLYRRLSGMPPELVLPAAKEFCLNHDNIAWVLRIVEEMADPATEWDIIDAVLAKHPPVYERDPSKKLQLLTHIQEIDDPQVPTIIVRYLDDPDEGVRFRAVEALLDIADEGASKEALVARLAHADEDSLRIRNRILSGFASLGWELAGHGDAIKPHLGYDFEFDGTRVRAK